MPWHDRTLVGTTEVTFAGDPAQVQPTPQEVAYLLDVYRHYFPGRPRDIQQQWAGLRVLPSRGGAASVARARPSCPSTIRRTRASYRSSVAN